MSQTELTTQIGKRSELVKGSGLRFELIDSARSRRSSDPAAVSMVSGFVIEYENMLYAYENRCPHLGVQLDWAPGVFFDEENNFLVCSTHGAHFEPDTGKCVVGPCLGQSLTPLLVVEAGGNIYVQNGRRIQA